MTKLREQPQSLKKKRDTQRHNSRVVYYKRKYRRSFNPELTNFT